MLFGWTSSNCKDVCGSIHLVKLLCVTFSNFENITRSAFSVQAAYASLFIHVESKTWRRKAIRVLYRYRLILL